MLFVKRKALFPGFSGKEKPSQTAPFVTFPKSNNGSPAVPAGTERSSDSSLLLYHLHIR